MWWLLILTGLCLGPAANFAIYQFAYFPRPISPWQRPTEGTIRSHWARMPIVGWLLRRNEANIFGRFFWVRPLLIELGIPVFLVFLFHHVMAGNLSPIGSAQQPWSTLFATFVNISILGWLLVIATFIDFDERTIPDLVTVPGTLFALASSAIVPNWRLRELDPAGMLTAPAPSREIHAYSPFEWPLSLCQGGDWGLIFGLLAWFGWCFGLLNRRWITRRGWGKAWSYFWAILRRDPSTLWIGVMSLAGFIAIGLTYSFAGAFAWESFLSSLMGIALGGALVWSFRLVAALVMRREALGFGDVTLMAMVGAFVGWQDVWISFFVSPFFALAFVVAFWIITRDPSTPFGPYLSMAVLYTIWNWSSLWDVASQLMLPPELLIAFWTFLLIALAVMLGVIEFVKMSFVSRSDR